MRLRAIVTLLALLAALGCTLRRLLEPGPAFSDMLIVDGFATFFRVLVIIVGMLAVLLLRPVSAARNARRRRISTR